MKSFKQLSIGLLLAFVATLATAENGLPGDRAWLNRISYGARTADINFLQDVERSAFLRQQLEPGGFRLDPLPASTLKNIEPASMPIGEALSTQHQAREEARKIEDPEKRREELQKLNRTRNAHARASVERILVRAIYSPNQLEEQMLWFWLNHFSVYGKKGDLAYMLEDYQEAFRPHVFGKFRDLLRTSLTHPAMLIYLDNFRSKVGKLNENYARELLELHTLGVAGGYTQKDVEELARILTGVGVTPLKHLAQTPPRVKGLIRRGMFQFDPRQHDMGSKILLGTHFAGQGWEEVEHVVDLLANHPATARHVAFKLAQFFVAEDPPEKLVDSAAKVFQQSGGDIRATLRHLLQSPVFEQNLGKQFKSSWQYVISVARLSHPDQPPSNLAPLVQALNRLGQLPFGRVTPDGYPVKASAWSSPAQMRERFEFAKQMLHLSLREQEFSPANFALWSKGEMETLPQSKQVDKALLILTSPDFMQR